MPALIIGAAVVGLVPNKQRISDQWRERSTALVERYELSLRGARGIVMRQRVDGNGGGYSALMGYEGRQEWAGQLFSAVEDAQIWCEIELVTRTSY